MRALKSIKCCYKDCGPLRARHRRAVGIPESTSTRHRGMAANRTRIGMCMRGSDVTTPILPIFIIDTTTKGRLKSA